MIDRIMATIEELGYKDWLNEWDVRNIYESVSSLESGTYFEVGVAHGVSLAVASLAANEHVRVGGVDRVDQPDRDAFIKTFLDKFGKITDNPKFFNDDSQMRARISGPIDILYIDGDHTYEGILKDIASWTPWVVSGGTIMFDDYNDVTGVKQAVNETIYHHRMYEDFRIDGQMFICKKV